MTKEQLSVNFDILVYQYDLMKNTKYKDKLDNWIMKVREMLDKEFYKDMRETWQTKYYQ